MKTLILIVSLLLAATTHGQLPSENTERFRDYETLGAWTYSMRDIKTVGTVHEIQSRDFLAQASGEVPLDDIYLAFPSSVERVYSNSPEDHGVEAQAASILYFRTGTRAVFLEFSEPSARYQISAYGADNTLLFRTEEIQQAGYGVRANHRIFTVRVDAVDQGWVRYRTVSHSTAPIRVIEYCPGRHYAYCVFGENPTGTGQAYTSTGECLRYWPIEAVSVVREYCWSWGARLLNTWPKNELKRPTALTALTRPVTASSMTEVFDVLTYSDEQAFRTAVDDPDSFELAFVPEDVGRRIETFNVNNVVKFWYLSGGPGEVQVHDPSGAVAVESKGQLLIEFSKGASAFLACIVGAGDIDMYLMDAGFYLIKEFEPFPGDSCFGLRSEDLFFTVILGLTSDSQWGKFYIRQFLSSRGVTARGRVCSGGESVFSWETGDPLPEPVTVDDGTGCVTHLFNGTQMSRGVAVGTP